MSALRLFGITSKQAAHNMAVGMTLWSLTAHRPVDTDAGLRCWLCRHHPAWPCPEVLRLTERLDELRAAG